MVGERMAERGESRRTVLAAIGIAGLGTVAGCLGEDSDDGDGDPDPISLKDGQVCDVCDMDIGVHPGPVGQAFYDDASALPEGREEDEPTWFCSGRCTYTSVLDRGEEGTDPEVLYVTDYSGVEWSLEGGEENRTISAHLESEAFASVENVTFVVGSEVEGAMGGSIIGFTDSDNADSFEAEHGGYRYDHDEISRDVIDSLGM